jgi:predicted DNA-binding antitoxin AbrB/MazE fold protein
MTKVTAIYENGVLRPTERLALQEGASVDLAVLPNESSELSLAEWEERLKAAKSIQEWVAVANSCPQPDDDDEYDVIEALNSIRRENGERPLTRKY